jgi:beta-carotene 3-hydroxylase
MEADRGSMIIDAGTGGVGRVSLLCIAPSEHHGHLPTPSPHNRQVPAMALCLYGFLTPSLLGGLAFGLGSGITLFGMSYMFVHDGLVHRRFPVGPIADVPALQRIAAAHKLHHAEKYGGVPFGLFLGPQELEAIGAGDDLDKLCEEMAAARKGKQ